jgi:hypothetical protein
MTQIPKANGAFESFLELSMRHLAQSTVRNPALVLSKY